MLTNSALLLIPSPRQSSLFQFVSHSTALRLGRFDFRQLRPVRRSTEPYERCVWEACEPIEALIRPLLRERRGWQRMPTMPSGHRRIQRNTQPVCTADAAFHNDGSSVFDGANLRPISVRHVQHDTNEIHGPVGHHVERDGRHSRSRKGQPTLNSCPTVALVWERNGVRLPTGHAPCRGCNFHPTPTRPPAGWSNG